MDRPSKSFHPSIRLVNGQQMVLFPQDQKYVKRVNNLNKQVFVLQKWNQRKGQKTERKKGERQKEIQKDCKISRQKCMLPY